MHFNTIMPREIDHHHESKPRSGSIVFENLFNHGKSSLSNAMISPDYDCRPLSPPMSPLSETSESSCATDDTTASKTIGFGRMQRSVIAPLRPSDDLAQSKIVGFGWRQHSTRHSICGAPLSLVAPDHKLDKRLSLPTPMLPHQATRNTHRRGLSLDLGRARLSILVESSAEQPMTRPNLPRKISVSTRQPPRPLLLPQQVQQAQTQASLPLTSPLRLYLASVSASRPVKFLLARLMAMGFMRAKQSGLPTSGDETGVQRKSILKRLRKLYRKLIGM
ncbi:hypothetical protein R3P38DRAFT_2825548 [Favolaschia claudopus]|uniref:Uncharacterized protein n=1 Tax=Favolaschia claudopus TaxID=2862362 RepID=A0AAW0EI18_9AGAR